MNVRRRPERAAVTSPQLEVQSTQGHNQVLGLRCDAQSANRPIK